MKCSDSASKAIIPGKKMPWRLYDEYGLAQGDLIAALREEAYTAIAAELKKRASDTLDKVLFVLSSGMKNAYARSDA